MEARERRTEGAGDNVGPDPNVIHAMDVQGETTEPQGELLAPTERARPGAFPAAAVLLWGFDGRLQWVDWAGLELQKQLPPPRVGEPLPDAPAWRPLARGVAQALGERTPHVEVRMPGALARVSPLPGDGYPGGALGVLVPEPAGIDWPSLGKHPLLRLLAHQVPGALWVTDQSLRVTLVVGRLWRRSTGKTVAEMVGGLEAAGTILEGHAAALAGESRSLRVPWSHHWLEVRMEPLRGASGKVIGTLGAAVDVTRRKLSEDRLRKSEEMLAESQRVSHIGSWEWDIRRDVVTWSDEMFRIYGISRKDFGGTYDDVLRRSDPTDAEATRTTLLGGLRKPGPFTYDFRIVRPNGELRTLHARGAVVVDEGGRPTRMTGTCWDVTEARAASKELERTNSVLSATLDSIAEGILVVDTAGRVTTFNQSFLRMWGIPSELADLRDDAALLELAGGQLHDPEEFRRGVQALYGRPNSDSFDVLRFKDGRVFERYSKPQRIDGQTVGRVWSFHDVTIRDGLLSRATFLAEAGRLLASLDAERAMDAVASLAITWLAEVCSVDLFGEGRPRRLLAVSRDAHIPAEPPRLPQAVFAGHSVMQNATGRSFISVPLTVRGRFAGALTMVAAAQRRYGPDDLELVEELGRRCSLSFESAELYEEARRALRAREEFLAVVAHEVRGPLTSMRLAIGSLRQALSNASPQAVRLSAVVEREERRIARFIDDLLDLAALQSGAVHFEFSEVDLVSVVRDVVRRLAPDLTRSGSALQVEMEPSVPGTWDAVRLEQIISNLLMNAIKFGLGNPIHVRAFSRDGEATFQVRDQGLGIPAGMESKIFEPFERAVPDRQYGGLGLGLYIAKKLVTGLGGSIELKPENPGALFTVHLPQARARA